MLLASQLYLLRREASENLLPVLEALAAAGYDGIEFCGSLFGHVAQDVRRRLDALGLKAVSDHVTLPMLENDLMRTLDERKALGCEFIVLGWLDEADRHYSDRFDRVLARLNDIIPVCMEAGLPLAYHNHHFEFTHTEAGDGLTRMLEGVGNIRVQLDAGWLSIMGEDPLAWLGKYAGRYDSVHLKDYLFTDGASNHDICPVGMGMLDYGAITAAAAAGGARWLIVDQDDDSRRSLFEAASLSAKYLRSLGHGE